MPQRAYYNHLYNALKQYLLFHPIEEWDQIQTSNFILLFVLGWRIKIEDFENIEAAVAI